jgi:threonine/homoserine/homoserine lactone efflux protein
MLELIPSLIPLLIVDILNPVLFALLVVAVGTERPIANSSAFLAGHTIAYFVSGIVIALGLERITARLDNPQAIDFFVELAIGVLCLWAALAARGGKASEERRPEGELTPVSCFTYGAIVNFIGVPFALPYLAAIDQILKANLSAEASIVMLGAYNLSYALPFAMVPLFVAIRGDASKPMLEKISSVLVRIADKVMPLLLLLLGIALIADAISYLVTGASLW